MHPVMMGDPASPIQTEERDRAPSGARPHGSAHVRGAHFQFPANEEQRKEYITQILSKFNPKIFELFNSRLS
jgi:hypothetical protein